MLAVTGLSAVSGSGRSTSCGAAFIGIGRQSLPYAAVALAVNPVAMLQEGVNS